MKKPLLVFSLLSALALPGMAKEYKLPKENPLFSITFPQKWKVTYEDESVDAISPDEAIEMYAQTDDSETIEDSVKESIDYLVGEGVTIKPDSQKDHKGKLAGMDVAGVNWDATDENGPCRVSLSFIDVGQDQVITLLYWGSEEAETEHAKELQSILESIKQLKEHKKGKTKAKKDKEEEEADADTDGKEEKDAKKKEK